MNKVLVVDDDKILRESVKNALQYHNFQVEEASDGNEAVDFIYREDFDLVVMDVNMPKLSGIEALKKIKNHNPSIIVLILTAYSNVGDAVLSVKEGAYNYLEKPISADNLVALIKRALKARSLVQTSLFSAPQLSLGNDQNHKDFIGHSNAMKKVFDIIWKLSCVKTPVLIRGESGTGKELVAKAIHFNGPRKDEKFVTINCAAIPDTLIESELFGHEKGSFTGANERKIGKFQYADGGTIFLDEIGDVSPAMQVKLLRVLQEGTFTPVGLNREINVDVRVIAASNKIFEEMIKENTFREDLFYRLNVLPVFLPPLRERKTDIPHLVDHYISYFNDFHSLNIEGISEIALKILAEHNWPGNIRELRNVIEHAFIIESSNQIQLTSLPLSLQENLKNSQVEPEDSLSDQSSTIDFQHINHSVLDQDINRLPESNDNNIEKHNIHKDNIPLSNFFASLEHEDIDFQIAKDVFEKEFIILALKFNKGKINKTALNSNIPKKTLLRKIEKYQINPKDFYGYEI
jgi:DNA-binding NtrC family response regulator